MRLEVYIGGAGGRIGQRPSRRMRRRYDRRTSIAGRRYIGCASECCRGSRTLRDLMGAEPGACAGRMRMDAEVYQGRGQGAPALMGMLEWPGARVPERMRDLNGFLQQAGHGVKHPKAPCPEQGWRRGYEWFSEKAGGAGQGILAGSIP